MTYYDNSMSLSQAAAHARSTFAPDRTAPTEDKRSLFQEHKSLILSKFKSIPTQCKKLNERTAALFKSCNQKIQKTARKLNTMLYISSISHDLPVLTSAKNYARPGVIWKGHDVKLSNELKLRVNDPKFFEAKGLKKLDPSQVTKLNNMKIEGGATSGICFGASLTLIKTLNLAHITSEEELKSCVGQYKKGFSAEAAGLQAISENIIEVPSRYKKAEVRQEIEKQTAAKQQEVKSLIEEKFATLSSKNFAVFKKELIDDLKKNPLQESKEIADLIKYRDRSSRFHYLASLIDLEIKGRLENHDKTFFPGITHSDAMKEKFNQLEEGYHQLSLQADETTRHAVVYIKKDFGSYIFDPNFGLFKCEDNNPAKTLCDLLNTQYPGKTIENQKENGLEIYQYALSSK